MRVKTMQVMWHEEKPVYSVDFHLSGVFATGGGDKDVKVRNCKEAVELQSAYKQSCSGNLCCCSYGRWVGWYTRSLGTRLLRKCVHQIAHIFYGQVELDAEQNPCVKHLGNLVGHTRDVNTVRFSPSGKCSQAQ